ncbi:hypothetical protein GCM10028778_21170 [Barrientosiimonas marina]
MFNIVAEFTMIFRSHQTALSTAYNLLNTNFQEYSVLSHDIYQDLHNIHVKCTLDINHKPEDPYRDLRDELHFRFTPDMSFASLYIHATDMTQSPALSFVRLIDRS